MKKKKSYPPRIWMAKLSQNVGEDMPNRGPRELRIELELATPLWRANWLCTGEYFQTQQFCFRKCKGTPKV